MPDTPIDMQQGSAQKPMLSDDTLSHYRETLSKYDRMLADPELHPVMREYINGMKAKIRDGVAVTGQTLEKPDPRSVQQKAHDQRHAMQPKEPGDYALDLQNALPIGYQAGPNQVADLAKFFSAMSAPVALGQCIARELGQEHDQEKIDEALKQMGKDPEEVRRNARAAINHAATFCDRVPIKLDQLGLFGLVQLGIFGAHIAAWQKGRPQ